MGGPPLPFRERNTFYPLRGYTYLLKAPNLPPKGGDMPLRGPPPKVGKKGKFLKAFIPTKGGGGRKGGISTPLGFPPKEEKKKAKKLPYPPPPKGGGGIEEISKD